MDGNVRKSWCGWFHCRNIIGKGLESGSKNGVVSHDRGVALCSVVSVFVSSGDDEGVSDIRVHRCYRGWVRNVARGRMD